MEFLDVIVYENTVGRWLLALLIAALGLAALGLVRALLVRQLSRIAQRTANFVDDVLVEVVRESRSWFLALVALTAGLRVLALPPAAHELLDKAAVLGFFLQLAIWSAAAIRSFVRGYTEVKVDADAAGVTTVRALGFIVNLVLWTVLFLMALSNVFGIEITAMVAGLGVGGIAVALAVQNILGDLFASLSIVLDKPFVYGDFIIVDDLMGTVEHVGLKTTRVRSLSGEQLVFANSDLLNSRIRNFKRMYERRVVFKIGVVYQTPRERLARIPEMIREIVESLPDTRFDRAHFKSFGDFSLDFEVVYYVLDPDFNLYMDRQQSLNLELYRRFEEEGIEFAYPTQTLFLTRETSGA